MTRPYHDQPHNPRGGAAPYHDYPAPAGPLRLPSVASLVSGPSSAEDEQRVQATGHAAAAFGPPKHLEHASAPHPAHPYPSRGAPMVMGSDPYRPPPVPSGPSAPPYHEPPRMAQAGPVVHDERYHVDYRPPLADYPSPPTLQRQHNRAAMPPPDQLRELRPGKVAIPFTPQNLRTATGRSKPTSPPKQQASQSYEDPTAVHDGTAGDSPAVPAHPALPTFDLSPNDEYTIHVRQQPVAARSCGFGERDRRVIDPPPIVQLSINNRDLSDEDKSQRLRYPYYVVHCTIYSKDGEQDCSIMPEDYRSQRRLMGSLAASPFVGLDENGKEGCFFCFSDLSCRTGGEYRLKFSLVILEPHRGKVGKGYRIRSTVMSDVFTVYNAKEFPGMEASSALAKRLKEQGCLISIKKGRDRGGGRANDRDDSSDDFDEDEPRPSKRKRRGRD